MKTTTLFIMLLGTLLWTGCAVENVEPENFGTIEGRVIDSETGEGIANASITTNPGTEAVLTNENGTFLLSDIPTGNYLVQATKEGYASESVRVTVTENDTTSAQILLDDTGQQPGNFLNAEVNSFFNNTSDNDTTFVEVSYSISNNSESKSVSEYEIYFKIYTAQEVFSHEERGDSLHSGQKDIGSFTKYIRNFTADSVVITDIYAADA